MKAFDPVTDSRLDELQRSGQVVAYFGYGSLVNRATHRTQIIAAVPARVSGWQREWQPRPDMTLNPDDQVEAALLTARRAPGSAIDGLLVFDHIDNLPAVDLRENDYHRRTVSQDDLTLRTGRALDGVPIYIYEADPAPMPDEVYPILQSYLDAVMQGFLREHGEAGLADFIDSTGNFDIPILVDREWPIYPRAVELSQAEAELIDRHLERRGVVYRAR